jgi:membrane-associated phospholipid phosphatase
MLRRHLLAAPLLLLPTSLARSAPVTAGLASDATAQALPGAAAGDWMRIAMGTAVRAQANAPEAARLYAFTAIAMHDAYALASGAKPYALAATRPANIAASDAGLVVQCAAAALLSELYPRIKQECASMLETFLSRKTLEARSAARDFGVEIGRRVFKRLYYSVASYVDAGSFQNAKIGEWRPTTAIYRSGLEPDWPRHKPFALESASQFRPPGPPDLKSETYARALLEVETYGRLFGGPRSEDQELIARFWLGGMATSTPPGQWNGIAIREISKLPLGKQLEILLVLNIALADAGLAAWDAKYRYNFWRPVSAVRQADDDGNATTRGDKQWSPLFRTPLFPEYVSGHSTFSAAAARVLTSYLGGHPFTADTETMVGLIRSYSSFDQAAAEAGQSRIYCGIHFAFSNKDGLALGKNVADWVLAKLAPRLHQA